MCERICTLPAVAIMPRSKGKIPLITFGAIQPLNLSDEDWPKIEAAYGQSLSQKIRAKIKTATIQFLQLAGAEAPANYDTETIIRALSKFRKAKQAQAA
jgi:hypothetical protein